MHSKISNFHQGHEPRSRREGDFAIACLPVVTGGAMAATQRPHLHDRREDGVDFLLAQVVLIQVAELLAGVPQRLQRRLPQLFRGRGGRHVGQQRADQLAPLAARDLNRRHLGDHQRSGMPGITLEQERKGNELDAMQTKGGTAANRSQPPCGAGSGILSESNSVSSAPGCLMSPANSA
jgi:hypothetical protein